MAELRGRGDLAEGDFLLRVGIHKDIFAVKGNVRFLAVEQFRAQFADLCPQLHGALFDGLAGNVGRAGGIGAGIVGRNIGIRTEDGDVVQPAVQYLGGDLR